MLRVATDGIPTAGSHICFSRTGTFPLGLLSGNEPRTFYARFHAHLATQYTRRGAAISDQCDGTLQRLLEAW